VVTVVGGLALVQPPERERREWVERWREKRQGGEAEVVPSRKNEE
jgi:hypothetical protein